MIVGKAKYRRQSKLSCVKSLHLGRLIGRLIFSDRHFSLLEPVGRQTGVAFCVSQVAGLYRQHFLNFFPLPQGHLSLREVRASLRIIFTDGVGSSAGSTRVAGVLLRR